MLPKEKRLRNTRDFKRVYQRGSFFSLGLFSINFLNNRTRTSRIGVVINKKVEPKAVGRNRLKRQFREAARKFYTTLPEGYDLIITIKGAAKGKEYMEIEKSIKEAFERVKK